MGGIIEIYEPISRNKEMQIDKKTIEAIKTYHKLKEAYETMKLFRALIGKPRGITKEGIIDLEEIERNLEELKGKSKGCFNYYN